MTRVLIYSTRGVYRTGAEACSILFTHVHVTFFLNVSDQSLK